MGARVVALRPAPAAPAPALAREALDRLWPYLRAGLFAAARFERDAWIAAWRVDVFCRRARLVVDVTGPDRPAPTARRDWLLAERGCHVLRFTAGEVLGDLPAALEAVAAAVLADEGG